MAQLVNVRFNRSDAQPWGFRLQGGKDFGTPLVVQKVAGGSIAANAGLVAGDAVIKVNGLDVFNMRHKDAQDAVVRGGNNFEITVQRGGSTWRPSVTPAGNLPAPTPAVGGVAPVTRTSLAAKPQEVQHIGSGFNSAARPYAVNGSEGVKSIVNKQYNTPVGIYSDESIAETLSAQAEVLAGGVLGVNFKKNEKIYNSANSEVFKMLQEAENDPNEPVGESKYYWTASHAIGGQATCTSPFLSPGASHRPSHPINLKEIAQQEKTTSSYSASMSSYQEGVFVRIKEKNLHVDCFKCATCGTPLKNQGYFNINNKLYCDIHAKLAAINNPPPGTEGYLPVPIKPNTKLSASTISAALTTHHGSNVGVSNGAPQLGSPLPAANNTNLTCATNFASNSCVLPQALSSCESTPKNLSPMASIGVSPIHSRQSSDLGSIKSDSDINHKNICNILNDMDTDRNYLETDFSGSDLTDEGPKINGMHNGTHNRDFVYKTLSGSVIRSVYAPGKGKGINYKLNTNVSGPKPFSSGPLSPPSSGPKSPSIYPPPTSAAAWSQPKAAPSYEAPKAAPFGSSTLPRATVGTTAPGDLGPECGHPDAEHFMWPPHNPDADNAPTASPLYVPPPGTQHVIVKPLVEKQSQSAPDLSYGTSGICRMTEAVEMESGSESYTSTSATTTSEEMAHRMFHTQTSVPSYTVYESADSDVNEMDYASAMHHKQSICSAEVSSFVSETRGAQYLADTLDTTCLVERMRSLTPRPPSPPPIKPGKHVEFSIPSEDQTTEVQEVQHIQKATQVDVQQVQEATQVEVQQIQEASQVEVQQAQKVSAEVSQEVEQSTQFQPIDIPEQKPLPQSNVSNTVPQEWESAMVKALKTAPETPYHIVNVQEGAVEEKCEKVEASQSTATTTFKSVDLPQLDVLIEKPAEGTIMSSLLTTVPCKSVKFEPKVSIEPIPLPEETKPYFPPPINMKVVADDSIPGRKSGMLEALITAPDRPYSPFGHDVSYQMDDLPRPTEQMTLRSALTVAPNRPFTPVLFDSNGLAHPKEAICSTSLETVQNKEQKFSQLNTSQSSAFQSVKTSTQESQFSASQSCRQECRETVCEQVCQACQTISEQSKKMNQILVDTAATAFEQVSPRHETPSEMLEKSIQSLKISDRETFRQKAGEVISGMLQARLDGKKATDINQNRVPCTNGFHLDSPKNSPPPENGHIGTTSPASNGHESSGENLPNDIVRYRSKTNKNLKPELISHARDRRSYIEKEPVAIQEDNQDKEEHRHTEEIANNLENGKHPVCCVCDKKIARGPFITALGRIWCPDHFICVNAECRRPLADIGFVEEKGNLYCEYCFEKYIAPACSKCSAKIKGDCLNAIGKHFHPECFTCAYCGKLFGNSPFFLEEGNPYCEADWNELFTTKCFACGFPVEAGDRWVEALSHNYHSQCFNCTTCKKNLEGQSFFAKGGRPYCKNHAR